MFDLISPLNTIVIFFQFKNLGKTITLKKEFNNMAFNYLNNMANEYQLK